MNQQIVIYVFARVVLGLAKLLIVPSLPNPNTLQAGYGEVRRGGTGGVGSGVEPIAGGGLGMVGRWEGGGEGGVEGEDQEEGGQGLVERLCGGELGLRHVAVQVAPGCAAAEFEE